MARAVFLDRDGTINEEVNHLSNSEQFRLLPGAGEAVRTLNQKGWLVIVITNQSGLARGYFTEEELAVVHQKMKAALDREGARIDGIYVCPHQLDDGCSCRKPGTALFDQAAQEFNIDLSKSFAVGDKMTDLLPGARLGCRTVLILTGHGQEQLENKDEWEAEPDYIASDLLSAAQWILAETET
jgi:D-glycero-D-manno-heptose 1,7-bisphosphate phosphatase